MPVPPFEQFRQPESTDIDELGHVNNVVYLRWVQEAAVAHWQMHATPAEQMGLVWVALRHEIDYLAPALPNDRLLVRTWVGKSTGLRFDRHTEFRRVGEDKLLAQAVTVWCPVDPKTGRPARVAKDTRDRFSVPE